MASVISPVLRHAGIDPDHTALRGAQRNWTYAQLRDAALAYAQALHTEGIGPGDRVMLIAPTVTEFVITYFGIQALGAVVVPVNTMSTPAELEYVIGDAGCSLVVGWHELGPAAAEAAAAQGIPYWNLNEGAQVAGDDTLDAVCNRAPDDVAVIVFTSGTTGRPKGAELTVGNLLSAGDISARMCDITPEDRVGTGLPLFHVFGQTAALMSALTGGATVSLLGRFTAKAMLDMLVATGSPSCAASRRCGTRCCMMPATPRPRTSSNCGWLCPVGRRCRQRSPAPSRTSSAARCSKATG